MVANEQENASSIQRDKKQLMKLILENVQLIKNDLTEELLEHYLSCGLIAVDCEMMGLNPIRDRLCLVQICDENQKVALVQIAHNLEPKDKSPTPNLKKLFEEPKVRKIFHFARTDLAFLHHWLKITVHNVFCTKSASKLVRTFTDKHGLKEILKELLSADIDKNTQLTDWGAKELTKEQIRYAATDVLYLVAAYHKLVELLKRENRLELAEEVNRFLPTLAKLDLLGYTDFIAH